MLEKYRRGHKMSEPDFQKDPLGQLGSSQQDRMMTTQGSGMFMSTRDSFRPMSQASGLSVTSSNNLVPNIRTQYLQDMSKTYRTLDFGVSGRNGLTESKTIANAQKHRQAILKSYDDTAKLLSRVRTPINADVCSQYSILEVSFCSFNFFQGGYREAHHTLRDFKTAVDLLKIDMNKTQIVCHQNLREIEQHFPSEYDKLNFHIAKEVRNQQDENWKLKEQVFALKKERDGIFEELLECSEHI